MTAPVLASVVISTYNRADALPATLEALARQDIAASEYEVVVVDDGSTDETSEVLARQAPPYRLTVRRLEHNRGVSAGRNAGITRTSGSHIVMLSDDLLVPPNFISRHLATLERFPDRWVVGGFTQLPALADTSFGRFLEVAERGFAQTRLGAPIDDGLYEMTVPTARNLSMSRASLERVGLFDERFRVTCEDQDLADRATQLGIRFVYDSALECIHNDRSADLRRYCRFQRLGAGDTARLCDKYPEIHARGAVARTNAYVLRDDGFRLAARKLLKPVLSAGPVLASLEAAVLAAERRRLPDRWLHPGYRFVIGLSYSRGFREGLAEVGGRSSRIMRQLRRPT
jgi:GT2 family glycosyltransferase